MIGAVSVAPLLQGRLAVLEILGGAFALDLEDSSAVGLRRIVDQLQLAPSRTTRMSKEILSEPEPEVEVDNGLLLGLVLARRTRVRVGALDRDELDRRH